MSIPIEKFRNEIIPYAQTCPSVLIDRMVRFAAIEFCENTLTWRQPIDQFRIRSNLTDYDITPPDCSRIVTVIHAEHGGVKLIPITEKMLDDTVIGWRNDSAEICQYFYLPDKNTIRLVLKPNQRANKNIKIECIYRPSQDATILPDILYDYHLEAISHGAKHRLFAMPAMQWSSPDMAIYSRVEFDRLSKKEKVDRMNDYTKTSTLQITPFNYNG